mmetsp:Transcript_125007/g.314762  ORF Transcript_125007/g.314762 Transcript_125007/m.314762 type:complete len:207 (+) Transcript_125007:80-700(+)
MMSSVTVSRAAVAVVLAGVAFSLQGCWGDEEFRTCEVPARKGNPALKWTYRCSDSKVSAQVEYVDNGIKTLFQQELSVMETCKEFMKNVVEEACKGSATLSSRSSPFASSAGVPDPLPTSAVQTGVARSSGSVAVSGEAAPWTGAAGSSLARRVASAASALRSQHTQARAMAAGEPRSGSANMPSVVVARAAQIAAHVSDGGSSSK